jgi:hypothetical protein
MPVILSTLVFQGLHSPKGMIEKVSQSSKVSDTHVV